MAADGISNWFNLQHLGQIWLKSPEKNWRQSWWRQLQCAASVVRSIKLDSNLRLGPSVNYLFSVMQFLNVPCTCPNPSPALQYKLCKVKKLIIGTKGIPHLVTHDARTIRYPDPLIKVNDTVRIDLDTSKITDFIKFDTGRFLTGRTAVLSR